MRKGLIAAAIAISIWMLGSTPGMAESLTSLRADAIEAFAQASPRRARPRIRVQPIYPYRHYHSLYPLPYDIEYPGPNARRECVDRYVIEHRPSGTVIVPRMRCRWVRG